MRLVLDTNVALSGMLWNGAPRLLLEAATRRERVELWTSRPLLEELAEVLNRPSPARLLAVIRRTAQEVVTDYINAVSLVTPLTIPTVVAADPDDDHVIAAAITAEADIIVSGDRHLLSLGSYQAIRILAPAEALGAITRG